MAKAINRLLSALFMSGLLLASMHTYAQHSDSHETNWYKVEIFIFANEAGNSAQGELWPSEHRLRYPNNSVQLTIPAEHSSQALQFSDNTDSAGTTFSATLNTPENTNPQLDSNRGSITHTPVAFEKLTVDQLTLTQQASILAKQNDFRPLFHQAWLQTMEDRDNSLAIIIRGGDPFDDHFELEGTIKLSVERYLHIQTDLWLSRFINAAASEKPNWDTLPKVPALEMANNTDPNRLFIDASAPFAAINRQDSFDFIEQRQYRVDSTVVVRQDRRMRSEELHYIDHPLLGVLIKVIPHEVKPAQTEQAPITEPEQPPTAQQ